MNTVALSAPQGIEWFVIGLVILLLFGAKRLPDMARGVGRSMRILKSETKGLQSDDEIDLKDEPQALESTKTASADAVSSDENSAKKEA